MNGHFHLRDKSLADLPQAFSIHIQFDSYMIDNFLSRITKLKHVHNYYVYRSSYYRLGVKYPPLFHVNGGLENYTVWRRHEWICRQVAQAKTDLRLGDSRNNSNVDSSI